MRAPLIAVGMCTLLGCGQVESTAETDGTSDVPPATQTATCDAGLDLNGDGFGDLVVPENVGFDTPAHQARVYLGSSNGFGAPQTFALKLGFGQNPIAFPLGDVRGNGSSDVAFDAYQQGAAEQTCGPTQVLRSEGGALQLRDIDAECPAPGVLDGTGRFDQTTIGDLDGDGQPETFHWTQLDASTRFEIVADNSDVLTSLVEPALDVRSYFGAGDLNGDGSPDVLGYDAYGQTIRVVLLTTNGGRIQAPVTYARIAVPNELWSSASPIGDVNGDGLIDFQVESNKTPTQPDVRRFLALSGGVDDGIVSYAVSERAGGPWNSLQAAGDINCDGYDGPTPRCTTKH